MSQETNQSADLVQRMYEAGVRACHDGRMKSPALCSEYMEAIDGLAVGARIGNQTAVSLAKHWHRGYSDENLKDWEEELRQMREEEEAEGMI